MTRFPFHPFLFAMLPVLSMFAANPGQRHGSELPDALAIVAAAAGLLILVVAAVYRDLRKAALWVSVLLLVLVAFDSLYAAFDHVTIGNWRFGHKRYVMPLTYLAVLAWGVWLYRRPGPLRGLTGIANMAAIGAVLPPAITLIVATTSSSNPANARTSAPIVAGQVAAKPDIYYLIFDRYGDEQTAREYGFENDIDEYLTSKGFYVPPASRSNYIKTILSLSSSLNVEYLDEVVRGRERSANWAPVYNHVWRHRVGAFLRSQGYSYTHLGSWFYPTSENPQATRNLNYYTFVPRKVLRLLDAEIFSPVQRAFGPWLDERLQNWHRVRRQLDDVLRLVPEPGPKFVFLHVLVPHPPYVFDSDGSYVTRDQERQRSFAENYRNQTLAANAMIRRLVDGILRDSASPPVIIVQGDEGPYPPGTASDTFDWRTATASQLRVRSGILNAYYLPGVDENVLYPSISPVNSFRVVFNTYFDTKLPLLPDRTIRHVSDLQPFAFDDITNDVTTMARAETTSR
jgi:Sulfatase